MSDKIAQEVRTRETHGMRTDINDATPTSDVKAPNVFERVKEEIEAVFETIHPHKETNNLSEKRVEDTNAGSKLEKLDSAFQEKDAEAHNINLIEKAKEGVKSIMNKAKSPQHHHKESHGRSGDIDENTPVTEIKGPNVFERAKEELEALVDALHHKEEKEKTDHSPKKEEGCFGISVGKGLEKVCSPFSHKKD